MPFFICSHCRMHRISRQDLFSTIYGVIACSRLKRRSAGRQVHASLDTQQGAAAVAELICDAIDNDSKMVISAEMVGHTWPRLGKWGVDEPVPATVPEPPKPPGFGPD